MLKKFLLFHIIVFFFQISGGSLDSIIDTRVKVSMILFSLLQLNLHLNFYSFSLSPSLIPPSLSPLVDFMLS